MSIWNRISALCCTSWNKKLVQLEPEKENNSLNNELHIKVLRNNGLGIIDKSNKRYHSFYSSIKSTSRTTPISEPNSIKEPKVSWPKIRNSPLNSQNDPRSLNSTPQQSPLNRLNNNRSPNQSFRTKNLKKNTIISYLVEDDEIIIENKTNSPVVMDSSQYYKKLRKLSDLCEVEDEESLISQSIKTD